MAPRALWTGSITFGLVNVPVRLYSAVSEHKLQFHFVHQKDDSPIGYQKICKLEEKPVPDKEIVKAFEYRKGEYVYMEDDDFEAARVEGYKTIDITDFVPYEQIDPIYFAHTYYLGPQNGGEKVYSLLAKAMEESELAAIAKFVMRDRQYLGALRVREGTITLEQLYFDDEIRPVEEIRSKRQRVDKRELEMARQLIASFGGNWQPEKYEDTYRDALLAVIKAKRKGEEVHVAAEPEEERPTDLLEALRASVEASKGGRRPAKAAASSNGARGDDLEELTKSDLDKRARKAGIEGRSKMSKEELVEALRAAA
jgi:DNA end-binding protein Ku